MSRFWNDESVPSGSPESRPLSDISGYSDEQTTIKKRVKSSSNIQVSKNIRDLEEMFIEVKAEGERMGLVINVENTKYMYMARSGERESAENLMLHVCTFQRRPLTRYLPIRGETLDLRSHIETAGHQVDLCPHVSIDSSSCRGYLQKMGSRFHTRWNKRWFVFDRVTHTLTYYLDRTESKQRGGAYFQAIEEVYVDHANPHKSPNPSATFVVKSSSRSYFLIAPSPEAMRIWVDVIFTGAEGHLQYLHH